MRLNKIVLMVLVIAFILPVGMVYGDRQINVTDITQDGYINLSDIGPTYTRVNNTANVKTGVVVGDPNTFHGFIEYNITEIPDTALIDSVFFNYWMSDNSTDDYKIRDMNVRPSLTVDNAAGNTDLFDDAANGTIYISDFSTAPDGKYVQMELAGASTDLNASLGVNWFAIGTDQTGAGTTADIDSSSAANPSFLTVNYHIASDTEYQFSGPFFENGTRAPAQDVTLIGTNFTETFNLNGSSTFFSTGDAVYVTWEISPGIFRRIFVGEGNQNITIFNPEDSFTIFGFNIRDYTGASASGELFLSTKRSINGTLQTIERLSVENTINSIPTTLVINRVYVIDFEVGPSLVQRSTFLSNTLDLTPTIVLNEISFDRQIQLSSKFLFVDADRPTATSLRVNFTNTLEDTIRVTVVFRTMNGGLVDFTTVVGSDSFSYTWNGANNVTDYFADVIITTTFFGTVNFKQPLPYDKTFGAIPSVAILGTIGTLDMRSMIGFIIIFSSALLLSTKNIPLAVFSIAVTASIMNFWGFFPVSSDILVSIMIFSVLAGLGFRRFTR